MAADFAIAIHRFELGLLARAADVAAVREALPELFDNTWSPTQSAMDARHVGPFWPVVLHTSARSEWVEGLRRWLATTEEGDLRAPAAPKGCPISHSDCPLNDELPSVSPSESVPAESSSTSGAEFRELEQIFRLLSVGGGPAGGGGKRFLDMLRKATKGCKGPDVRQVILTDPFLHSSFDEAGKDGDGFEWFQKILRDALLLQANQEFDLFLNPRLGTGFDLLRTRIVSEYPKAKVKTFAVERGRIHDRFYLVRGSSGAMCGVFGPSLNGLSGGGVFLMGDLDSGALQQLNKVIRCR